MLSLTGKKHLRILWASLLVLALTVSAYGLVTPSRVQAWSAVWAVAATHQSILDQAFKLLKADPAFDAAKFPTIEQIQASDGVSVVTLEGFATGPGPDVQKTVKDSDHYYNPRPDVPDQYRGGAPAAVKREFGILLSSLQGKKMEDAAHAAGWAAHFLSDVETPYHVNGTTYDNFLKIYNDQIKPTNSPGFQFFVPPNIRGPLTQEYASLGMKSSRDSSFRFEAENYIKAHKNASNKDWFDPWYWNGESYLTSSHVLWEAGVGAEYMWYSLKGYSQDWHNPTISLANPNNNQSSTAEAFTKATALDGLANQAANQNDMGNMATQKAVQRVYTLWRASFSALKPTLQVVTPDYNQPEKVKVTASVNNIGGGDSVNTQVKLTVSGGVVKGNATLPIGNLKAGTTGKTIYDVEVTSGGGCSLKLEAIGSYTQPDLQYAVVEAQSDPLPSSKTTKPTSTSDIDHSVVVVLNLSSQAQDYTLDETADKILKAVEAFPDKGIEIGMVIYGGSRADQGDVASMPFLEKSRFQDFISSLYGRGGESIGKAPLARSIRAAGQMISEKGKGSSATIILISNSGIDDCGGDPIQAAKELNSNITIQRESWIPFSRYAEAANSIPIKLQVFGIYVNSLQEEQRMRAIASAGNGQYYTVTDINQLPAAIAEVIRIPSRSQIFSGIDFQVWWFIAGGAAILIIVVIIFLSRRRPSVALRAVTEGGQASIQLPSTPAPPALPSSIKCPQCGTQSTPGTAFCIRCGSSLAKSVSSTTEKNLTQNPVYCPQCGKQNPAESTFCNKCGSRIYLEKTAAVPLPAQPLVTARNVSGAWWLLPIFLALPGGLIAWAAIKPRNPDKARRMIIVGICITVFWALSVVPNVLNSF